MPWFARSVARTAALLLAVTLGTAGALLADTINVTSGALVFGSTAGRLAVAGERGFTLQAGVDVVGGIYDPWLVCSDPVCGPGFPISLFAFWSGNDLPGTVTLDGKTYPNVGSASVTQTASVQFFGEAMAPALGGGSSAVVTAPFTFQGFFLQPTGPEPFSPFIRQDLVGGGQATLWLEKNFDGTTWRAVASRYEFQPIPTPEPATLVLVGSGLALALGRRRRVRNSRR